MIPLIHIGSFEISTWRVVVLAGVILCWILFMKRATSLGYSSQSVFPWLVLGLPVGTVGGHLFNKIIPALTGAGVDSHPLSGLTVIGSIVSCVVFSIFYIRYVIKKPPMPLLDAVAFTFPLSIFIGRFGCLLNGCCYGRRVPDAKSNSFLSVFTLPTDFYVPPSQAWQDYRDMLPNIHVWNLPMFLMANAFFVLIITEYVYRNRVKWRLYPGTVFAATTCLYAAGRFPLEYMRHEDMVAGTLLNPWQLSSLALFILSLLWLSFCMYKRSQTISLNI